MLPTNGPYFLSNTGEEFFSWPVSPFFCFVFPGNGILRPALEIRVTAPNRAGNELQMRVFSSQAANIALIGPVPDEARTQLSGQITAHHALTNVAFGL